jgi:hypothetical protein
MLQLDRWEIAVPGPRSARPEDNQFVGRGCPRPMLFGKRLSLSSSTQGNDNDQSWRNASEILGEAMPEA